MKVKVTAWKDSGHFMALGEDETYYLFKAASTRVTQNDELSGSFDAIGRAIMVQNIATGRQVEVEPHAKMLTHAAASKMLYLFGGPGEIHVAG